MNCCGFLAAKGARSEPDRCFQSNVIAATTLADCAALFGLPYVMISTDLVFDGTRSVAYIERDMTKPLGHFGQTKWEAERQVKAAHLEALILRTGPLFGASSREMLAAALHHAARDAGIRPHRELIVSPTYIPDLADALLDLLIDGASGLWHLVNDGAISADDLLRRVLPDEAERHRLQGRSACNLALTSQRGLLLPKLGAALDRFRAVT